MDRKKLTRTIHALPDHILDEVENLLREEKESRKPKISLSENMEKYINGCFIFIRRPSPRYVIKYFFHTEVSPISATYFVDVTTIGINYCGIIEYSLASYLIDTFHPTDMHKDITNDHDLIEITQEELKHEIFRCIQRIRNDGLHKISPTHLGSQSPITTLLSLV